MEVETDWTSARRSERVDGRARDGMVGGGSGGVVAGAGALTGDVGGGAHVSREHAYGDGGGDCASARRALADRVGRAAARGGEGGGEALEL